MITLDFGFGHIGLLIVPMVRLLVVLTYGLPKLWAGYCQVASLAYFQTKTTDFKRSTNLKQE